MTAPLWISEQDVESLLDPHALVAAVTEGFPAAAAGRIREAASTRLDGLDGGGAYMTVYPARAEAGLASVKLLAGRPENAAHGLPEIDAVTALVDPASGFIVALISARALTASRTAAATAAVLRRLMPAAGRIGLVGTGAQALAHGRILAAAGLALEFRVASPRGDKARADATARLIAGKSGVSASGVDCSVLADGCDAVILMTLARIPVDIGRMSPDLVLVSIGPFYPEAQELDPAVAIAASLVVSDHPERLRRQWAGSPLLDVDSLQLLSAADLIAGRTALPRTGRRVFLSDGRGFQDNVAAEMIYRAALAEGRGRRLE